MDVLPMVVAWAVPAACAALAAAMAALFARTRALAKGIRSLLRCELVRAHRRHCIGGEPMGLDDLEYIEATYSAYHGLGGNGTGTKLYEDIRKKAIEA